MHSQPFLVRSTARGQQALQATIFGREEGRGRRTPPAAVWASPAVHGTRIQHPRPNGGRGNPPAAARPGGFPGGAAGRVARKSLFALVLVEASAALPAQAAG